MDQNKDSGKHTLARMKAGDRHAFDRFFRRHAARVLVYIHYNLGNRLRQKLEPADILQNIYLRVFRDFESFLSRSERMGAERLLVRMADHEITEAYRHHFKVEKRDARREVAAEILGGGMADPLRWKPSDATSVSALVIREEEYQRALRILGALSPLEQFVTVARVIEGLPLAEIAELVGKSRGAVQMILARTRDKLRARAAEPTEG